MDNTLNYDDYQQKKEKALTCDYCLRVLSSSSNLKSHITLCHTEELLKKMKCNVCDKLFLRQCDLGNHMALHKRKENKTKLKFQCSTCLRKFIGITGYEKHIKRHEDESFKCSNCTFTTHSNTLMNSHKKFHSGELPYSCTVCFKKFKQKTSLTFHIRTHTGERPYKCNMCA